MRDMYYRGFRIDLPPQVFILGAYYDLGLVRKNWRGGFSQESMILTNATISNILTSPSLFISAPSKSTAAGLRI